MKSRGEEVGGAIGVTMMMTAAAAMLTLTMMGEGAEGQNSTRPVPAIRNMSYPLLDGVPITDFRCNDRPAGYYADPEAGCQLYHMCDTLGKQYSYLCPNYTLFNQKVMVCDHWYMVNCSDAPEFYDLNSHIGKIPLRPPVVENGIELGPAVLSSIPPTVASLTFAGSKGNTAAKRSGLPSLSPSSASSSPSSSPPSSLSFFKSSPFSVAASTSPPSSPSISLTLPSPSSFPFSTSISSSASTPSSPSTSLTLPSLSSSPFSTPVSSSASTPSSPSTSLTLPSPSSRFTPFASASSSASLSSSSTPSTSPPPTSPFTRPSTLLKPLKLITASSLPPVSTSFSFPSSATAASSPPSSLLQRVTTPASLPAFPPSLPISSPLSSPVNLSTPIPTRSASLLTPLASNSSLPPKSSPFSTQSSFLIPSSSSSSPSSSSSSPSSPRPFSVPENLDIPSLLARGKGQDRPVFGAPSSTTSSPSPTKPSVSPHLQSVAFALKPQKPNKNDLRGVVLRPVLIRLNGNDDSNEISPSTFLPLAEATASSAATDTPILPSVADLVPQMESTPLTTPLTENTNPLTVPFMLDRELQPPLHPFEIVVNHPSLFLQPPAPVQSTRPLLSFPLGRVPNKNALSTNQKQESLTFLSPPSLSTERDPRLLPNITSFRFTSFRPNRDFFIPTANFPMPPLEEDHHLHEGLMLQKVISPAQISHNVVEDPSQEDHSHMFHMTMIFPVMMGAQRFGSLQLNPECPHCHPAFLKPDQCHPCVIIK